MGISLVVREESPVTLIEGVGPAATVTAVEEGPSAALSLIEPLARNTAPCVTQLREGLRLPQVCNERDD
jgi:hypothetical protein